MIGKVLCKLGLHKFQKKTFKTFWQFVRCERTGCEAIRR